MKTILVTGAGGFLGSNLCYRLCLTGDHVICLDNFFTGNYNNIHHLKQFPNFEIIRHDITEPIRLEVDQIYNLACPGSPIHYKYDPIQTFKTSIYGALNTLGIAKRTGATVLQASTSEIYGDPLVHPQTEEYCGNVNPIGPRACYDESKRGAETLFYDYHRQHNVKIKIARIFNTYGPNMDIEDGRIISNFICQALQNKPITIYGDGKQTRSFCYVDDLIDGLIKLMNSDNDIIGPINLGNPIEKSVYVMAVLIREKCNSYSKIVYYNLPEDDPIQRCPNIKKAKEYLDWEPTIDLEEGLDKTISYFSKVL